MVTLRAALPVRVMYSGLCVVLVVTLWGVLPGFVPGGARADAGAGVPDIPDTAGDATAGWWTATQAQLREGEYALTWQAEAAASPIQRGMHYQAPNRAQNFRTYFTSAGMRMAPRVAEAGAWAWGLALRGYGAEGALVSAQAAEVAVAGNRIVYRRGALTEWYVNSARGLEHGFTLDEPVGAGDVLVLALAVQGTLRAQVSADGQAVEFVGAGVGGARGVRYGDLHAYDARGRALPAHMALDAAGLVLSLVVDTTNAVYPLTVDPLATTPAWSVESNQALPQFGITVATAGDVNNDGYADVLVGASAYDNGSTDEGAAFLYQGSASGLSLGPNWSVFGAQESASLGTAVATAGDVNGDGYADVVVGAPDYDNGSTDEGRAYVYHGGASGLSLTPNWTGELDLDSAAFGHAAGTAGDVNGDGYADLIVGATYYTNGEANEGAAYVYFGGVSGLSLTPNWSVESNQSGAEFGMAVGTAGDVNGDGYADVFVGAPRFDNGQMDEGSVFVYHGGAGGPSLTANWSAESDQANGFFGTAASTAGDVNGDGYADVVVGAYGYSNGQAFEGRAYVYYGSASGLSLSANWTIEGNQVAGFYGFAVGTAGDVNGDGYADVLVGALGYANGQANEGGAFVYYGAAAGLSLTENWGVEGDQSGALLGTAVSTAGDVNGDGYADVLVSAIGYDNGQEDEGEILAYHGGPAGLSAAAGWNAEGDQADAHFGFAVGTAGDVNGDGYADVIVGAPDYDNGQADEGKVFVYHGAAAGLSLTPTWSAESDQAGARFGTAVATAGDVNGDGYADVIVGASAYSGGEASEGRAYVYHGGASGLSATPNWTAEVNQASALFGTAVGTAGDVNGDGYADVIVGAPGYGNGEIGEGRVYVYYGAASGLNLIPNWTAESNQVDARFGTAVAGAGDVNGDGYTDVLVGARYYDNTLTDEGAAFVFHGGAGGLNSTTPNWSAFGGQAGADFGSAAAGAGDVNGDGYADVIVGAYQYSNGQTGEGRAFVYHGAASGLSVTPNWSAEGEQVGARFGFAVAAAGDVNGDGYADVVVGAPQYADPDVGEGRAFVYHGGATGLNPAFDWSAEGEQMNAGFGFAVASAGDVNGDGYAEVLVGASVYDAGQPDEGRTYAYYGNAGNGLNLVPQQRRADNSAPVAPWGLSGDTQAFRVRLTGRSPFGRGLVKLEWEVRPAGTLFTGVPTGQSAAWLDSGTAGVTLNALVSSLAPNTLYHWRVRIHYHPATMPFQQRSRWLTVPWNGWQEADVRTAPLATATPTVTITPTSTRTATPTFTPTPVQTITPTPTPTVAYSEYLPATFYNSP